MTRSEKPAAPMPPLTELAGLTQAFAASLAGKETPYSARSAMETVSYSSEPTPEANLSRPAVRVVEVMALSLLPGDVADVARGKIARIARPGLYAVTLDEASGDVIVEWFK